MNTEVDIFKGVDNLPTYTEDDQNAIDVGSSNSIPRISIQGGVFSLAVGPALTPLGNEIVCLILGSSGTKDSNGISCDSKRYYKTAYTGEKGIAPDCAAINGITPDSTIEAPLCTTCAACPMQVWGSKKGRKGGKAKACSDYRRLAICIMRDDDTQDIYQLDVPTVSLSNLREYNAKLTNVYHVPIDAIIAKLTIGVIDGIPQITFKEFKALSAVQYEMVRKLRKDELVATITTREVAMTDVDDEVEPVAEESKTVVGPAAVQVDDSEELKNQIEQALAGEKDGEKK